MPLSPREAKCPPPSVLLAALEKVAPQPTLREVGGPLKVRAPPGRTPATPATPSQIPMQHQVEDTPPEPPKSTPRWNATPPSRTTYMGTASRGKEGEIPVYEVKLSPPRGHPSSPQHAAAPHLHRQTKHYSPTMPSPNAGVFGTMPPRGTPRAAEASRDKHHSPLRMRR
eukprot:Sspe_Gene.57431::Locus_31521_Transcript_2_2_Confidence_0.500_Length_555::g.57431::m.57431